MSDFRLPEDQSNATPPHRNVHISQLLMRDLTMQVLRQKCEIFSTYFQIYDSGSSTSFPDPFLSLPQDRLAVSSFLPEQAQMIKQTTSQGSRIISPSLLTQK